MTDRIFSLMTKEGVKAKSLSESTGIQNSTFTQWKKGLQKPSTEAIVKIADYFNVSADYLLGRTDVKETVTKKKPHLWLIENERKYEMDIYELAIKLQEQANKISYGKYQMLQERAEELARGLERHLQGKSRAALSKQAAIDLELTEEELGHFTLDELISAAGIVKDTDKRAEDAIINGKRRAEEKLRKFGETTNDEVDLLTQYRLLNETGQRKVLENACDLVSSGNYTVEVEANAKAS